MIWLGQVFCVILSIDEQVLAKALQIPDLRLVRPEYALNVGPDFSASHSTQGLSLQSGAGPGEVPGKPQPKQFSVVCCELYAHTVAHDLVNPRSM